MKECIDREALLQDIKETVVYTARPDRENLIGRGVQLVLDRIAAAPAADVATVVRCKDCKHYQHYGKTSLLIDGKNIKAGWCQRRIRYIEAHRMLKYDFCSYGERRD